jgi:hypothetical protein
MPKEYAQKYGLDLKNILWFVKEYSEQRRKSAVEKGLDAQRGKRKAKTA